jgi:hypothetical protein
MTLYSPDLAYCDFLPFSKLAFILVGKRFDIRIKEKLQTTYKELKTQDHLRCNQLPAVSESLD